MTLLNILKHQETRDQMKSVKEEWREGNDTSGNNNASLVLSILDHKRRKV